jgi:hypothetical protein
MRWEPRLATGTLDTMPVSSGTVDGGIGGRVGTGAGVLIGLTDSTPLSFPIQLLFKLIETSEARCIVASSIRCRFTAPIRI